MAQGTRSYSEVFPVQETALAALNCSLLVASEVVDNVHLALTQKDFGMMGFFLHALARMEKLSYTFTSSTSVWFIMGLLALCHVALLARSEQIDAKHCMNVHTYFLSNVFRLLTHPANIRHQVSLP